MNVSSDPLTPDAALVERIVATPSRDLLRKLFAARTARWRCWYFTGEGGSSGLFSDLEEDLEPQAAFLLLPVALEITLEQGDRTLFVAALSLLLGLAKASETTEIPSVLEGSWGELKERANQFSEEADCKLLWNALTEWYRRRP